MIQLFFMLRINRLHLFAEKCTLLIYMIMLVNSYQIQIVLH